MSVWATVLVMRAVLSKTSGVPLSRESQWIRNVPSPLSLFVIVAVVVALRTYRSF
jgi:hypothetical protein